jgi:hypothetical protein
MSGGWRGILQAFGPLENDDDTDADGGGWGTATKRRMGSGECDLGTSARQALAEGNL